MLMKNNLSLQFFPTSTAGTDRSVNAQSLDLNEKHVAAVGCKMALRNHNESSFHHALYRHAVWECPVVLYCIC